MNIPHPLDLYDVARFYSKVNVGTQYDCWNFTGSIDDQGYGHFFAVQVMFFAHRFSYILAHGKIPDGLMVRHKCDNPSCCNPHHLETGTHTDNMLDRSMRDRTSRGEKNGKSKITSAQAVAIVNDNRTHTQIAQSYGISPDMVSRIKRGINWSHATGLEPRKIIK